MCFRHGVSRNSDILAEKRMRGRYINGMTTSVFHPALL
jgi:hypothetical protein